jgi:hypothetical protein
MNPRHPLVGEMPLENGTRPFGTLESAKTLGRSTRQTRGGIENPALRENREFPSKFAEMNWRREWESGNAILAKPIDTRVSGASL